MTLTTDYINTTIGNLQTLHARFANEYCNMLKRHTGNRPILDKLTSINKLVGWTIQYLYDYDCYSITTLNELNNNLTEDEVKSLIDWCYRKLTKYNNEIYIPTNPNIYL